MVDLRTNSLDSTGTWYQLESSHNGHRQHAVVTAVAASLRSLIVDGVALIQEYPAQTAPPFCAGWVLVPWPNRVDRAQWVWEGEQQQLAVTELATGHAIHGLLTHTAYQVSSQTPCSITLSADVEPQAGYPFALATSITYELQEDGIVATHRVKNSGSLNAPVAVGAHPFLRLGDFPTEDLTLVVGAGTHIDVDERLIPTGTTTPAALTGKDLRQGRRVGNLALDDAWTEITRNGDGGSTHYLQAPDGRSVQLHMDESFGYIQTFTTNAFATDKGMVTAVAVEPMTAPPNALNSGQGLRWLAPGEDWTLSWGITLENSAAGIL